MSTVARDVGLGPGDLKILRSGAIRVFALQSAPFYTGIRLKRSGSGTRYLDDTAAGTTLTEVISYAVEVTFARVDLNFTSGYSPQALSDYGYLNTDIRGDYTRLSYPGAGEAYLLIETEGNQISFARQLVSAQLGSQSPTEISIGTRTGVDTNPTPDVVTTEDIRDTIFQAAPYFYRATTPSDPRYDMDRWGYGLPVDGVDISGWTASQWRDLRGVHSAYYDEPLDSWTSNDVRHTYEWELV